MTTTVADFGTDLYRQGRTAGPGLLFEAWYGRRIGRDVLRAWIAPVWSMAEYPSSAMTQALWREMFDEAGYTVSAEGAEYGAPADRPAGPIRLYRGSVPTLRRRWSWTTDYQLAQRFALGYAAGGFNGRMPGKVYVLDAPAHSLLCHVQDRRENEYVVDTCGLKIREDA